MILLDDREETITKQRKNLDLLRHFNAMKVDATMAHLEEADAVVEANGPDGIILIGIERKRLHDMLNCVEDGRFNEQRRRMKDAYDVSVLMVEAHWKPHDPEGVLMEGHSGGMSWGYARPRGQRVMYAKLYRYLISVMISGVHVSYTRDPFHTAFNINEWHEWGKKKWDDHTSLREIHKLALPSLLRKPSLVRKWANAIDSVGVKKSELAERLFRSPLDLAQADEKEWLKIPGVGVKTAREIVGEIWRKR